MKEVHSLSHSHNRNKGPALVFSKIEFLQNGPYNLHLDPGECVGLTGPSGVGKSQLLRALSDVIPHGGECFLGEQECASFSPPHWRSQVAMLPAESFWWYDGVAAHFPKDVLNDSFEELLATLGFTVDVLSWDIRRLSTGERQRLALLRTLVSRPQVLLLDEPTSALDKEMEQRVEEIVATCCGEQKMICLWVSHDREQLFRVARRVFRMELSGLIQEERL
jgi:ABC-type iron transport system FetAB ATPase subunit